MTSANTPNRFERKDWIEALNLAQKARLLEIRDGLTNFPDTQFLRKPEFGLAMIRGRAGGTGKAFNLGEVTVTRCVVAIPDTLTGDRIDGVACIAGRDKQRAELVAQLDAIFQDSGIGSAVRETAMSVLHSDREAMLAKRASEAAATKVDFFTMERGH